MIDKKFKKTLLIQLLCILILIIIFVVCYIPVSGTDYDINYEIKD